MKQINLSRFTQLNSSENQIQVITVLFIFWAVFFGTMVRLIPIFQADFPLNDGGLFYHMASELIEAGFRLPENTGYNSAGIPFAYPPLGLYGLALLSQAFPLLALVQWLPFVYSVLTIPAFFFLARTVLQSPIKAGLATVAFALVPSSMDILLWGGGVTRGLGFLFSILAARQLIRLFQTKQWKSVIAASILSALVVLSHPSAAFVTVLFAGVFWLWYGRNLRSAAQAAAVGGLVLVLTLPWWLPVVHNHGLQPFRAGLGSGWFTNVFIPFITLNTTQEPFLTIVMVIAVIGLLHSLYRKQFLLPLWLFASLLSQRDGYIYATLPVCLLFSNVLVDLVCPAMALIHRKDEDCSPTVFTGGARWLVSFFLVYSLINAFYAAETVRPVRVTPAEREAMDWVMDNTPTNARFLMLTFGDPLNTPFQEWFPAITRRINLTAVQGYEWLPDSLFVRRMESFKSLQPCMTGSYDCVEEWANERHLAFDYLLVHHGYVGRPTIGAEDAKVNQWISASLSESTAYQKVYQSKNIEIFNRNTNSAFSSP